ncbi:uncharacterized protein LOC109832680 [Asparagus officinalis]|nr:uncharacterized protein LOC109832680 [Asparagus officinalis]
MVCLACLLPLFLIPVVNALPLLLDFILGKVYRLFGWEYRKPARVPPACPYKPTNNQNIQGNAEGKVESSGQQEPEKVAADGTKEE